MAAYEKTLDGMKDRLAKAQKAFNSTYKAKDKVKPDKKNKTGMYSSYLAAKSEIDGLKERIAKEKVKIAAKSPKSKKEVAEGLLSVKRPTTKAEKAKTLPVPPPSASKRKPRYLLTEAAKASRAAGEEARKGFSAEQTKGFSDKTGTTDAESIFASFLVGGGIATGILKTLMKVKGIGDVVRWFKELKNEPSLPTVIKQIEKKTGEKVALPKPPARTDAKPPARTDAKPPARTDAKPPARTDAKPPVVTKPAPKQMQLPSAKTTGAAINKFLRTAAATAAIHGGTSAAKPPKPSATAAPRPEGKPAKPVQTEGISKRKDDMSGRKYKEKRKKEKVEVPAGIAGRKDQMGAKTGTDKKLPEDISWKKGHDPVTKFMEELLGTKRTVAQVKKDMAAVKEREDETEFYGQKRGGKVTAKRPSTKKYAMNRGGMASLRKPTRA
jgi:hypothetical protein